MALRTTIAEVKEILDTELTDPRISAFLTAANLTVTKLLGASTLSTDQLREIERWLTAHMIASTIEQQAANEGDAGASITYQGSTGMGLDATFYGQTVKLLDTTGLLAKSEKAKIPAKLSAVTSFS